jgi:hypothetical protein
VSVQQGNDGVVRQPAAFDAKIVNDIAKARFPHRTDVSIALPQESFPRGCWSAVAYREMLDDFSSRERNLLRSLTSPLKIQRFLDENIVYNLEPAGDTCYSPRMVLREGVAHCMEGALLGALALRLLGHPPLLVDLEAVRDSDHVLAVYRAHGCWGAVAKSDYSGLRYREPIYKTLRELAMSYFEHYYNPAGEKTLRGYSRPVNLKRFDRGVQWMTTAKQVWAIPEYLCEIRHFRIVTPTMERRLARMDRRLYEAGRVGGVAH